MVLCCLRISTKAGSAAAQQAYWAADARKADKGNASHSAEHAGLLLPRRQCGAMSDLQPALLHAVRLPCDAAPKTHMCPMHFLHNAALPVWMMDTHARQSPADCHTAAFFKSVCSNSQKFACVRSLLSTRSELC